MSDQYSIIRYALMATALYCGFLVSAPFIFEADTFNELFSETGPFERLSIVAWLLASAVVLWRIRPLGPRGLAFAFLYALLAAREADWHKAFTADSLLKSNYYRHTLAHFSEKLVAAIVALIFIGLLLYATVVIVRFLWRHQGLHSATGWLLLIGGALLVLGKVLDRAPAVMAHSWGIHLDPVVGQWMKAFEEGLEMITPLYVAASAWLSQKEARYLSA